MRRTAAWKGVHVRKLLRIGDRDDVNLRHLRAFDAVGRLGSLNRTGKEVHLSQSAVSYAIQQVEQLFQARLVDRSSNGSELTEEGVVVQRRVASFFDRIDKTVSSVLDALPRSTKLDPGHVGPALSWHHVRTVIAVVRLRGVKSAGSRLKRSEISVLRRLREVERLFGSTLFVRTHSETIANPSGEKLAVGLSTSVRELDYGLEEVTEIGRQDHGSSINFGCLGLARILVMPNAISEFLATYPRTRLRMSDESFDILFRRLRYGEIDFLVCAERHGLEAKGVTGERLFSDSWSVACREGHPLAARAKITQDDLLDYDWILPMEGTPVHNAFHKFFESKHFARSSAIETHAERMSWALLKMTDMLMISSRRSLEAGGHLKDLIVLPYTLPIEGRSIFMYTRSGDNSPRTHAAFKDMIRRNSAALASNTDLD